MGHDKMDPPSCSDSAGFADGLDSVTCLSDTFTLLWNHLSQNEEIPTESEQELAIVAMLHFAASQGDADLFWEVAHTLRAGKDACRLVELPDSPVVKNFLVYDEIIRTEGRGNQLEELLDKFVKVFIDYDLANESRSCSVLNKTRFSIFCEMKVQICLGKFFGPRVSKDDRCVSNERNLNDFEHSISKHFTKSAITSSPHFYANYAYLKKFMEIKKVLEFTRDVFRQSCGNSVDVDDRLNKCRDSLLQKHDWGAFLKSLRLYLTALQYNVEGSPFLLRAVREHSGEKNELKTDELTGSNLIASKQEKETSPLPPLARLSPQSKSANSDKVSAIKHPTTNHDDFFKAEKKVAEADENSPTRANRGNVVTYSPGRLRAACENLSKNFKDPLDEIVSPKSRFVNVEPNLKKEKPNETYDDNRDNASQVDRDENFTQTKHRRTRSKVIPWDDDETEALMEGIEIFGPGRWVQIIDRFPEIFARHNRTGTNLKDRWRSITRAHGRYPEKSSLQKTDDQ